MSAVNRRVAVIFATDVVGYSTSMEKDEELTLSNLKSCREILYSLFEEHGGEVFNTAGDSFLAHFSSAVSAVVCASEFQALINERNRSLDERNHMQFRVGVHIGDVIEEEGNLYGEGVNVAARLEALAEPGGVCISKTIHDFVLTRSSLSFTDMGQQQVKNTSLHAFKLGGPTQKYEAALSEDMDGKGSAKLKTTSLGWLGALAVSIIGALLFLTNFISDETGNAAAELAPGVTSQSSTEIVTLQFNYFSVGKDYRDELEHFGFGLADLFQLNLDQHPNIDTTRYPFAWRMEERGISGPSDASAPFYQEAALASDLEFMTIGSITESSDGDGLSVELLLYEVSTFQLISSYSFPFLNGTALYEQVDQTSNTIAADLLAHAGVVPQRFTDFPVETFASTVWEAFEAYSKANFAQDFGSISESAEFFERATSLDERFAGAWYLKSFISETRKSDLQKALKYGDRLNKSDLAEARFQYAVGYERDEQRLLTSMEQLILDFPGEHRWLDTYTYLLFSTNQHEKALRTAQQSLAYQGPNDTKFSETLVALLLNMRRIDEAFEVQSKINSINGSDPYNWAAMANIKKLAGDADGADESFRRAIAIDNQDPYLQDKYLDFLTCEGRFAEAEQTLVSMKEWAVSDDQKVFVAQAEGSYRYFRGQFEEALKQCNVERELVLSSIPADNLFSVSEALTSIAMYCEVGPQYQLGNHERVREIFQEARKRDFDIQSLEFSWIEFLLAANSQIDGFPIKNLEGLAEATERVRFYGGRAISNLAREQHILALEKWIEGDLQEALSAFESLHTIYPSWESGNNRGMMALLTLQAGALEEARTLENGRESECSYDFMRLANIADANVQLNDLNAAKLALNDLNKLMGGADQDSVNFDRLSRLQSLINGD